VGSAGVSLQTFGRQSKENIVWPFLDQAGWLALDGKGYKRAMRDLPGRWSSLLSVCPEIAKLSGKIQAWLKEHG